MKTKDLQLYQQSSMAPYKYIIFLVMLFLTTSLTSAILTHRIVQIGDVSLPGGIFVCPISYFLADVIAEVYGFTLARQVVWSVIICEFIFAAIINTVIYLPVPEFWALKDAYIKSLEHVFRLSAASIFGTLMGELVNIYLITKAKFYLKGKHFWLRSILASSFGEGVLTVITFVFAFVNIIPDKYVCFLIINGYFFKLIYGTLLVWPAAYLSHFLKQKENLGDNGKMDVILKKETVSLLNEKKLSEPYAEDC